MHKDIYSNVAVLVPFGTTWSSRGELDVTLVDSSVAILRGVAAGDESVEEAAWGP